MNRDSFYPDSRQTHHDSKTKIARIVFFLFLGTALNLRIYLILFIFNLAFTFQVLDKPWSQVSSLLFPGKCLRFFAQRMQHFQRSSILRRFLLLRGTIVNRTKYC